MDQRPEAGRIEVENGSHKINDGVIVHQPPGQDPEQRFPTGSLPTAGEPWMKSSFMRSGLSIGDGPRAALRSTWATKAAMMSWHRPLPPRQSPERGVDR